MKILALSFLVIIAKTNKRTRREKLPPEESILIIERDGRNSIMEPRMGMSLIKSETRYLAPRAITKKFIPCFKSLRSSCGTKTGMG
jgi:hypothetical protein